MIPFNFHHLYYFYAVTRHGSVSKAAAELRISQPALSAQLKHLEGYLGVRLFDREKKKLILTEDGHLALSYAKTIFDAGQEFLDGLKDGSQKGRLRVQVGVTNSVGKAFAHALVEHALRKAPDAHLLLREDSLEKMVEDLKDHLLDVVLSDMPYQASAEEGVQNQLAGRVPVVFCAHPKLAKNLKDAPFILPTAQSGLYRPLQEFFSTHKMNPRIVAEVQDTELMHRMALNGLGVAPLSRYAVRQSALKGKLAVLPQPKHDIHETLYLISKKRKRQNPLVADMLANFRL